MKTDDQKAQEILKAMEPLKKWEYRKEVKARYDSMTGEKREECSFWIYPEGAETGFICIVNNYLENPDALSQKICHAVNILPELIEALEGLHNVFLNDSHDHNDFKEDIAELIKRAKGSI